MADERPWGRRLIICCDGTWQSSVSSKDNVPSNVTKLCRVIARIGTDRDDPTKKWHQLVYYDSGIGTGNLSSTEAKRQGGTGAGLAENVIEAYNFIVLNYEAGDEIFCFGFSRGAYTARAVAGLVTDIGVIKPTDMQLFPQIYRAYMSNDEGLPFRETQAWKNFVDGKLTRKGTELSKSGPIQGARDKAQSWEIIPHSDLVPPEASRYVKVVGVWDTVGSLGIPDVAWFDFSKERTKYSFHNVKLGRYIQHAYHALALDERRKAFRPTLWYISHELKATLEREGKPLPELKQVWFPGVHINSGGGADDAISDMKGDLENLSTASFTWMLQCIAPHLTIDPLGFETWMSQFKRWQARTKYACTYHHPDWKDAVKSKIPYIPVLNPGTSPLEEPPRDPMHTHLDFDYGWGTGPIVDSYGGMYRLAGAVPRVPGHCQAEFFDEESQETRLDDINKFGATHEYIHPICEYRRIVRNYEQNSALKTWTRRFEPTNGSAKGRFWWIKNDTGVRLPEWVILEHGPHGGQQLVGSSASGVNYERTWYEKCERGEKADETFKAAGYDKDFLSKVDDVVDFGVGDKAGWVYP